MTRTTGISRLSRAEYDAMHGVRVNVSTLAEMDKSPAHYQYAIRHPDHDDTDAKKMGRAVHIAVFEPEVFPHQVVTWVNGDRRGNAWKAFKEEHAGREILTMAEHATCFELAEAVRTHPDAAPWLEGAAEMTALWNFAFPSIGGLPAQLFECRGRLDLIHNEALVDLKTTRNASPRRFGSQSFDLHYHAKAAWYVDGYERATGKRLPFKVIAVESPAPHIVQVYDVPDELLELGRRAYRGWLDRLDLCRRENRWPGYADGPLPLTLPAWAMPREDGDLSDLDLV